MNCREAEQHIFAERDGALDPNQRAALASHVADCAACRRQRDELAAAIESLHGSTYVARVPDPDIEWQKLRRQIRGATTPKRSWATWIGVPIAAAAAVALGLYIAPSVHQSTQTSGTTELVARRENAANPTATASATSTVVYVDDNSGWTFVWAPDGNASEQHI